MELKEKIRPPVWMKIALGVTLILAGFCIRVFLDQVYEDMHQEQKKGEQGKVELYENGDRVGRTLDYAENVQEDNKILQKFKEAFPKATVLIACEEDLTNDGCKDLIVIYNTPEADEHSTHTQAVGNGYVRLTVAIDSGNGEDYSFTDPIPAPVENQKIQFQNVDKKDEMEFVLQGQKANKVGYGIFRIIDGAPVNLFGEGMEEC